MAEGAKVSKVDGDKKEEAVHLRREIGLLPAVCFIIGTVVGSGIFIAPKGVLMNSGSVGLSLLVWALCGVLSLFGEAPAMTLLIVKLLPCQFSEVAPMHFQFFLGVEERGRGGCQSSSLFGYDKGLKALCLARTEQIADFHKGRSRDHVTVAMFNV